MTQCVKKKAKQSAKSIELLTHYLTEGVLTEQFVLENLDPLLHCIRGANVAIRWTLLHSRMQEMISMIKVNDGREPRMVFDKAV